MTEQKDSSAMVEETTPAVEATTSPEAKPPRKPKNSGTALGAVAIVIALALGTGLYINAKHQAQAQTEANQALADQLAALQQQANNDKQQLSEQLKMQTGELQAARDRQSTSDKQLDELQEKVTTISGNDARTWLLAQADYLVKLAGRKLWSDQDVTTAAALLKSADASLAGNRGDFFL